MKGEYLVSKLRFHSKEKLISLLDYAKNLEEKCSSSKILSEKIPSYVGTVVNVLENDVESGILAFAEFGTTVAVSFITDQGVPKLFMDELNKSDKYKRIIVFDSYALTLLQKYNHKNIEIILDT